MTHTEFTLAMTVAIELKVTLHGSVLELDSAIIFFNVNWLLIAAIPTTAIIC